MPPPSPEYTPPSLSYLVIYNPTLLPTPSSREDVDEDDEIENAHILFYTARERAVSRDVMLRQVGLAKALNNFSEMFAADGCDSIRSQRRRMIMLRPEPDFWIVASVDVARSTKHTSSTPSSKDKTKSKSPKSPPSDDKGKGKAPEDNVEYRENALFDEALRKQLQRGYDQFKLLHGSLQSFLDSSSRASLEKSLEQFFTPWAWKWDVDTLSAPRLSSTSPSFDDGPDFAHHLGLPLHPAITSAPKPSEIDTILENVYAATPEPATPLLLCLRPPSTFPRPSREGTPDIPPSLPRYLLSTIPPPPLPKKPRRASTASQATLRSVPRVTHKSMDATNGALSFMPPMPKNVLANMTAGVANPKKWGWPGYLTFGRSAANSRNTSPSRPEKPAAESSNGDAKAADGEADKAEESQTGDTSPDQVETSEVSGAAIEVTATAEPDSKALSSPVVDRHLLQDAIGASPITKPPVKLTPAPEPEPEPDATQDDSASPDVAIEDSKSTCKPEMDLASESAATEESTESTSAKHETDLASTSDTPTSEVAEPEPDPTPTEPAIVIPDFSSTSVHLDNPDDSGTRKMRLSYLTRGRLVFALVYEAEARSQGSLHDWFDGLNERVYGLLGDLDAALDRESVRRESMLTGKLASSESSESGSSGTRHLIYDADQELTTSSIGYEPTSPHFFVAQQILSSASSITEVFTRANNMKWFAAKRRTESESKIKASWFGGAEGPHHVEVYAEVGKKDASLVDVDHEVDALL